MRCVPWWKAYGPSWRTSCRISTAIEMALKLRPTGLGSGIDKDRPDYTVVAVGGLVLSFALEK